MEQEEKISTKEKIKNFINKCKIVLRVTKKPTKQELMTIVKVSGIGILIIGFIGFIIQIIKQYLVK
ncbi:MAG: protein translocase SEC61 complex subunit gamma [Candidatus Woesearchaeota archaeon]